MTKTFNDQKQSRNTLIEVLRLLFAFVVLNEHDFTPYLGLWLRQASGVVECFFIISGWYLVSSFIKNIAQNQQYGWFRSWWYLFKQKAKKILIPVIIPCFILNLCRLIFDPTANLAFLHLWYVHGLFIGITVLYLIFYFFYRKNKKVFFWLAIGILFSLATIYRFLSLHYTGVVKWASGRSLSTMTLGLAFSLIPKWNFKHKNIINIILSIVLSSAIVFFSIYPNINSIWVILAFYCVFPPLMYVATQLRFSIKTINLVCELSAPIYYFQSFCYFWESIFFCTNISLFANRWWLFLWALIPSIIYLTIMKLIKRNKTTPKHNLSLPETEKFTMLLEKKKLLKWGLFSIFAVISAVLLSLLLTSFIIHGLRIPNWENWWWTINGKPTLFNRLMRVGSYIWAFGLLYTVSTFGIIIARKRYSKK